MPGFGKDDGGVFGKAHLFRQVFGFVAIETAVAIAINPVAVAFRIKQHTDVLATRTGQVFRIVQLSSQALSRPAQLDFGKGDAAHLEEDEGYDQCAEAADNHFHQPYAGFTRSLRMWY